jgi:hypothetical protein
MWNVFLIKVWQRFDGLYFWPENNRLRDATELFFKIHRFSEIG